MATVAGVLLTQQGGLPMPSNTMLAVLLTATLIASAANATATAAAVVLIIPVTLTFDSFA